MPALVRGSGIRPSGPGEGRSASASRASAVPLLPSNAADTA